MISRRRAQSLDHSGDVLERRPFDVWRKLWLSHCSQCFVPFTVSVCFVVGCDPDAAEEDQPLAVQRRLKRQRKRGNPAKSQSSTSSSSNSITATTSSSIVDPMSNASGGGVHSRTRAKRRRTAEKESPPQKRCRSEIAERYIGGSFSSPPWLKHGGTPVLWFNNDLSKRHRYLPMDLFQHILLFVPAIGDLLGCRRVSRKWKDVIASVAEVSRVSPFCGRLFSCVKQMTEGMFVLI